MRGMGKVADSRAHNTITTDSKGVIVVVLRGKQTGESIRALWTEAQKHAQALRTQGKKVLILADVRSLRLSDSSSSARLESRKVLSLNTDASAVIGNSSVIGLTMYLVRIVKSGQNIRFFTSERKARRWLEDIRHPLEKHTVISLVTGVFVGLVGLLALIGWQINNQYLISGLPFLQPMNPVAAIGLIAVGVGFICYWLDRLKPFRIAGVLSIILGMVAALPPGIGEVIFGHALVTGPYAQLSVSAGVCFVAVGIFPFAVDNKKFAVKLLQYILGILIIGFSLFNIFGQLYVHDFIYSIASSFVMAFNLAIAFLAMGTALLLLVLYRQTGKSLGNIARIGWLVAAALIFIQVATYSAWSQAMVRNEADSSTAFLRQGENLKSALDQRVQAYINALHGFKGLFISSDYVDEGEFQSYNDSLNLGTTYPGLGAIGFITKVQEKDIPAFVAKHRSDTSLHPAGNPSFTITDKSDFGTHYISTYSSAASSVVGVDLGSDPSRLAAFQKADSSGRPVASSTVQSVTSDGVPAQTGFFITIPVFSKINANVPIGFVSAIFNYQDFFAHVFPPAELPNGLTLSISDIANSTVPLYTLPKEGLPGDVPFSRDIRVFVADRVWNMRLSAPAAFGLNTGEDTLPRNYLIGGQLFTFLLVIIFIIQARARKQGFELADSITEDLEQERNLAIANAQKNHAILSSIGDAVFAVDAKLRITLFNPSAQKISGYSEAEALGKPYDEVLKFELEDGRVNDHFIHRALAGHLSSMANHTTLIQKDGKHVSVADSAAPIYNSKHEIEGAIVVFRDVSSDYELDRAKNEFVSLASHQLRTPLSAINWYGEMLLNDDVGKLTEDQREYVQEISDGNHRMVELVDALLAVSRLEVGKLPNQPEPVDIIELIESLEKELTVDIVTKKMIIIKNIHKIPPVIADPKQLRMVLQNLLSNALKYTPEKGSVTITLRKATVDDMNDAKLKSTAPHWLFSVQDTGYGIPEEARPKIFSKLYRADNVRRLDVEGTGLGLYIVQQIVAGLKGKVWFSSMESIGTTFYIVLPFKDNRGK
jgi:PAS domain S-box-containing protein